MAIRGDGLKETLSQHLIDQILSAPQIQVRLHTEVTGLHGTNYLEAITPVNNQSRNVCVGDVRHGSVKRFSSAVGEGAMAVTFVHRYPTSH
jgi:thioredoxin reductase